MRAFPLPEKYKVTRGFEYFMKYSINHSTVGIRNAIAHNDLSFKDRNMTLGSFKFQAGLDAWYFSTHSPHMRTWTHQL